MLLDRGWHLAVCVTDLPLQTARRPVIAHVSTTHGVAVLSMPALGPVSVRKRTADTIVRLIGHMLGDIALAADAGQRRTLADAVTRRMRELGTRIGQGEHGVVFAAQVVSGNIWLLLGMLRANRPWRLALRLMRALAAAFAAGVFALVTSDIWRLAYFLGPVRLSIIALGSVAGIIVTIMVTTGLWERSPHPAAREQVILFNIVTAATVGIGVVVLYLALFIIMLASALLLVPGDLLSVQLGYPLARRIRSGSPGWLLRSRHSAARSAPRWRAMRPCGRPLTPISPIHGWPPPRLSRHRTPEHDRRRGAVPEAA